MAHTLTAQTAPHAARTAPTTKAKRLHYVQWLRVFLICLVVGQHSAEPYVITGGDWMVTDPASSTALLAPFVWNGTFFMGFFFLISGYFLDASIDRHGLPRLFADKLLRLGLPLGLIVVLVNGAIGWAMYGDGQGFIAFLLSRYLPGAPEFGPLWFVALLMLVTFVYAAWRGLVARDPAQLWRPALPGHGGILAFVLILGAATALIRVWSPIDNWVRLGGVIPVEPARLPQYLLLFAVGILAGRGRWFDKLDARTALPWAGLAALLFAVTAALALPRLALPEFFGLRVAWGFLEAPIGVGTILGLLVLARRIAAAPGRIVGALGNKVYGVYLIHVYVVIGLQMAMLGLDWPALAKFALVAGGAIVVSFGLAALLRLIPGAQRVL